MRQRSHKHHVATYSAATYSVATYSLATYSEKELTQGVGVYTEGEEGEESSWGRGTVRQQGKKGDGDLKVESRKGKERVMCMCARACMYVCVCMYVRRHPFILIYIFVSRWHEL